MSPVCFGKSTMTAGINSVHYSLLASMVVDGRVFDMTVPTRRRALAHDPGRFPAGTDTGWLISQPPPTAAPVRLLYAGGGHLGRDGRNPPGQTVPP